eukprot:TRINITY_DN37349_c0_g1_i1.p1 TRINITY_DN37349_c0_g1~~TRINITY_DN37349_c0_g1_i1.p1  ORF type:complete len:381 (-),score=26.18 TRINITY_DN37349_c0_g1_i1:244-1341(-)
MVTAAPSLIRAPLFHSLHLRNFGRCFASQEEVVRFGGRPRASPEFRTLDSVRLSNGTEIPRVGFGTAWFDSSPHGAFRSEDVAWEAVPKALEIGFRHIDTGRMYGNEEHIGMILGQKITEGRLKRQDVWITTKVCHPQHPQFGIFDPSDGETAHMHDPSIDSHQALLDQFRGCLRRLKLSYVDLLLIHWPGPFGNSDHSMGKRKRREMWTAMEKLYESNLARSIGVSNFMINHLEEILSYCTVKPMMNQVEMHPYLAQHELQHFCDREQIRLTAYCPLASGQFGLLDDPVLVSLARNRGVEPGQIVLRWLGQRGVVIIPKSTSVKRQRSNLECMTACSELTDEEMAAIDGLDCGKRVCLDPSCIA